MNVYKQGQPLSGLEPLAYLEMIGAKVIEGKPECTLHLDVGKLGDPLLVGTFGVTRGTFDFTYGADEIATLLEGRLVLTTPDGNRAELKPGDSVFTPKGQQIRWEVVEPVKKCFMIKA